TPCPLRSGTSRDCCETLEVFFSRATPPRLPGVGVMPELSSMTRAVPASDSNELLTTVDVKGCAGESGVGHDVDRECRDVSRSDNASDWQRGPELFPARVQLVAEERRRQRCVDKSGRDHVHADGCYFEGKVPGHGGKRGCERRQEIEAWRRAASAGASHEKQCPSRPNLAHRVPGDLQRQQEMSLDVAA